MTKKYYLRRDPASVYSKLCCGLLLIVQAKLSDISQIYKFIKQISVDF
jgi:hypothetical protein